MKNGFYVMTSPVIPTCLHELRIMFQANGFDIRLVGGFVRDHLLGKKSHDIDLCTDATPDEQRAIYRAYDVVAIDTGLQHGTWTVVLNKETYEITSLRTETDCDGRHAKVSYTQDWLLDLSRRDLTINAMQMDFDGNLIDPFGGQDDLKNHVVRFVGDPDQRMQEDYLRILRWFRFHARFGNGQFTSADVEIAVAIKRNMHGLQQISRERVWSEFQRILADPHGMVELLNLIILGVADPIGLPTPSLYDKAISFRRLEQAHKNTRNPVSLMAAYLGSQTHVRRIASDWHWSHAELDLALLITSYIEEGMQSPLVEAKRRVALDGVPISSMAEVLRVMGHPVIAATFLAWSVPIFPLDGDDLIATGMRPGPIMGRLLRQLRETWARTDYSLSKTELMAMITI